MSLFWFFSPVYFPKVIQIASFHGIVGEIMVSIERANEYLDVVTVLLVRVLAFCNLVLWFAIAVLRSLSSAFVGLSVLLMYALKASNGRWDALEHFNYYYFSILSTVQGHLRTHKLCYKSIQIQHSFQVSYQTQLSQIQSTVPNRNATLQIFSSNCKCRCNPRIIQPFQDLKELTLLNSVLSKRCRKKTAVARCFWTRPKSPVRHWSLDKGNNPRCAFVYSRAGSTA